MHMAEDVGTQKAGDINRDREPMDKILNGQEFRTSRGVEFDFDF